MLSSISWQQYLAAIAIFTAFYYLYVALRYYQVEISNLVNPKRQPLQVLTGIQNHTENVIGQAKLENGVSIADTGMLEFGESLPDEVHTETSDPSKELVSEAGNLIEVFKDIDDKPEFLNLLKILIGSYKRFKDEIDFPLAINRVLEIAKDKLQFQIEPGDIQSAWI